jgi:hypothetical protein
LIVAAIPSTECAPRPARRRAVAVALVALALTGCTTTVAGSAVRASGGPGPGAVDTSLLDVGNYPTKPVPLGAAGTDAVGRIVEAQRMSNYVTGPWEVDPTLIGQYLSSGLVLKEAAALTTISSSDIADIAKQHGFVNGFQSSREDKGRKQLANDVLRFPDAAAATTAATELAGSVAKDPNLTAAGPQPIPGHPEALATGATFAEANSGQVWQLVRSFTPHGPYVLMQSAQTVDGGLDAPAALVAHTLDLQAPLIDQFQATPPSDFPTLPLDPTGLLGRTLPIAPTEAQIYQRATYQPHGTLQLQGNPVRSAKLFTDTGMDVAAFGKTNVYQARDAAAATRIADDFADEVKPTMKAVDGVNGLPASRCMQDTSKSYYCLATADRYAIEVSAGQLPDAKQQVAAQYLMLTAR